MKCGARVALGVAAGYFLGRTKKVKLALMLGGMAAGRRAGRPAQLLAQGTNLLGQSPELARLTDEISGRLLEAGKGAAVAVATRQVEALTERVVNRGGTLTEAGGKTVSDVSDTAGGTVGALPGGRPEDGRGVAMANEREDQGGVAAALPTDALRDAGQQLLSLLVQRATEAATQRVSGLADRLTDVTESGGNVRAALLGGNAEEDGQAEDDADAKPGGLKGALSSLKDKMKDAFGGGGSGGTKKLKMTNIIESLDVGLPLRTTYDTWTQFADFPSFMKKVETVEQESNEKTNWTAKVFWSRRTWEATIVEQVPDSHIAWRSTGAKGRVDGAVSFTELGPNLTRVLLVLEYWPQGLFERTGNLWRAQGRRARLEFKHFRRHAMTNVLLRQEEVEGWRGEIRDSEVVKTHEEALEEESAPDGGTPDESAPDEPAEDELAKEELSADEEDAGREAAEDEPASATEDQAIDGGEDEDEAYDEDETYDEYADESDEYVDEADEDADEDQASAERAPVRSGRRG